VVFREIKDVVKKEFPRRREELEKKKFELKDNESESTTKQEEEEEEEEEDPHTQLLRRSVRERMKLEMYTTLDFHSNFALSITDGDPINIRELVDSKDGKI
jgi:hypothetical protein